MEMLFHEGSLSVASLSFTTKNFKSPWDPFLHVYWGKAEQFTYTLKNLCHDTSRLKYSFSFSSFLHAQLSAQFSSGQFNAGRSCAITVLRSGEEKMGKNIQWVINKTGNRKKKVIFCRIVFQDYWNQRMNMISTLSWHCKLLYFKIWPTEMLLDFVVKLSPPHNGSWYVQSIVFHAWEMQHTEAAQPLILIQCNAFTLKVSQVHLYVYES